MNAPSSLSLGDAFAQAMGAFDEGRQGEAAQLARQIVEAAPGFGGGHYLLGLLASRQGRLKRAIEHLSQAVTLGPDEAVPRLALARALDASGDINTALLHYRTLLAKHPRHAEAHARLGELLRRQGLAADAIRHCRDAIAANPHHAEALNTLGALLQERGETAEAAGLLARALELRPDWPSALNNYGVALKELGRLDDAVTILSGAVELRRDHAPTRANLAAALRGLNRLSEARVQAERATKLDPRFAPGWLELGLVRQAAGQADGAAAALERAVSCAPKLARAHFCLAEIRRQLGQTPRAAAHYRTCLDLEPDDRLGAALGLALCGSDALPDRAPAAFVRQLFDDYADRFDAALVDGLGYCGPRLLADAIARAAGPLAGLHVLDAGCGTGLAASVLRPLAHRLDGVDLSSHMLEKAAARGLYDRLDQGDLVETLAGRAGCYDLVAAADVLIYLGDLAPMMAAAAAALKPGGVLAFTTELAPPGTDIRLGAAKRFAHGAAYIRRTLDAAGLRLALMEEAPARADAGTPVPGLVVVALRNPDRTDR